MSMILSRNIRTRFLLPQACAHCIFLCRILNNLCFCFRHSWIQESGIRAKNSGCGSCPHFSMCESSLSHHHHHLHLLRHPCQRPVWRVQGRPRKTRLARTDRLSAQRLTRPCCDHDGSSCQVTFGQQPVTISHQIVVNGFGRKAGVVKQGTAFCHLPA